MEIGSGPCPCQSGARGRDGFLLPVQEKTSTRPGWSLGLSEGHRGSRTGVGLPGVEAAYQNLEGPG